MVRARTKSAAGSDMQPELRASTSHLAPNTILSERERLLQERQTELGRIFTKHDSLIRERFMLENYGLMLLHDPDVAKKDNTNEFLQFKNRHDLMRFMPDAGPSRATRHAQTVRISALAQAQAQLESASISVALPTKSSTASAPKAISHPQRQSISAKGKQKGVKGVGILDSEHTSAKARGKRKATEENGEAMSASEGDYSKDSASQRRRVVSMARERPRHTNEPRRELSRRSRSRSILTEETSSTRAGIPPSDRSLRKSIRETKASSSCPTFGQPTKRRRMTNGDGDVQPEHHLRITFASSATTPRTPSIFTTSAEHRPTTSGKSLPGKTLSSNAPPPRPTIRRIKLIVRPPARAYTSPRQRPPPASFGYSLPALLSSCAEIDGKTYSPEGLEVLARADALVLKKIGELKKKGRYPGQHLLSEGRGESEKTKMKRSPNDLWAHVVSEAIAARQSMSRHRFGWGGSVASTIHTKFHARWDLLRKDMEKEQQAEERRLRALAKSILKLVLGEWKRAVYTVRLEKKTRMEEEEARRGRMHLESILDQSGAILERQQMELVRSEDASSDEDDGDEEVDEVKEDVEGFEDGDEEGSEVPTEVDEEEGRVEFVQKGNRHVEFEVPLSDVDSDDDEQERPGDTVSRSVSPRSSDAAELDIDKDEAEVMLLAGDEGTFASVDVNHPRKRSEKITKSGSGLAEERDQEQDEDGGHSSFESSSSPPKASVGSISFLHDIRMSMTPDLDDGDSMHPDSIVAHPLAASMDTREMGVHMSNGLEHEESVILHNGTELEPNGNAEVDTGGNIEKTSVLATRIAAPGLHPMETVDAESDLAAPSKIPNGGTRSANHTDVVNTQVNGDVPMKERVDLSPTHRTDLYPHSIVNGDVETDAEANGHIPTTPYDVETRQDRTSRATDITVPGERQVHDDEWEQKDEKREEEYQNEQSASEADSASDWEVPTELQPYAVAHVKWEPGSKVLPPLLLRGTLRPYQQSGLEWLASLYNNETNGILADEMGLGKTIQTIALLAHLACDRGIWGPHLIIVPTSVLLNWEMEFKKFLPGFRLLSYHGTTKRRKELRRGWNDKYAFNVCITSYTLASRDQHIFKRKAWYYMVLDEAHMIKNFKSQRWNILLMFRSYRRLLLTGTPLHNNLTELWALLRFLMSGTNFANQKEFTEWFGIPLEKAIELGNLQDQEVQLQATKLHEMLRPFILRRMKKDVEKELPKKYEHLVLCRLSKRQRFLYDEFMSRRQTREDLQSGIYQKIANILMQLRKVCNHPDLFEVRPIVTSFAMEKSAIADFEIKELLIRRKLLEDEDVLEKVNLDAIGLQFTHLCNSSAIASESILTLEEVLAAELIAASPGEPPPKDLRTIEGYKRYRTYQRRLETYLRYQHMIYLNRLRCSRYIPFSLEAINAISRMYNPLTTACEAEFLSECRPANHLIKSYLQRAQDMSDVIEKFAFATPTAVARDMPKLALREVPATVLDSILSDIDSVFHRPAVKLQIAFPDVSLLQYDCGKLQELDRLLRERRSGGHRVLIFTQMTRILDILEMFLNYHGYLYLRLDGATRIEDRQYITERFNADPRIFAFIASSRSGGVGINLTGADTVIFYDSDFNPQMDKQCEDRAHRIGQIRDVHIYRFISQYTVEEAMLRKANQKRSLDDLVIQQGEFDWKNFFRSSAESADGRGGAESMSLKASALQKALVEFEDFEDAEAAKVAAREEAELQGEDRAEFGGDGEGEEEGEMPGPETPTISTPAAGEAGLPPAGNVDEEGEGENESAREDEEEEGGTIADYMIKFVRSDPEFFRDWVLKFP